MARIGTPRTPVADDARNACSANYAAAWRAAKTLGYRKLITYNQKPLGFAISELRWAANWSTGATQ